MSVDKQAVCREWVGRSKEEWEKAGREISSQWVGGRQEWKNGGRNARK